jgi:5-enolpyruvylshikimate-3-phosphate synthase
MLFVNYNSDGEIISFGDVVDSAHCVVPGLTLLEEYGNPRTQYVKDGVITSYTPEQASAKRNRPRVPADWSNASMSWVEDILKEQE